MPQLKLCSWNVNGIRASAKKGFFEWLKASDFDIVCLQETKAQPDQLDQSFTQLVDYPLVEFNSAERKGYSGVANYFKKHATPEKIIHGFELNRFSKELMPNKILEVDQAKKITAIEYQGIKDKASPDNLFNSRAELVKAKKLNKKELEEKLRAFNSEGRVIQSKHKLGRTKFFYLLNIYFPNGGASTERLQFKLEFYETFLEYIKALLEETPYVIVTGDLNTAHHSIDLARPDANLNTTGFMPVERMYLDWLEELGFVDSFRHYFPERTDMYTWWSFRTAARKRNIGWRIDYFYISRAVLDIVADAQILTDVLGSDHCPISLALEL